MFQVARHGLSIPAVVVFLMATAPSAFAAPDETRFIRYAPSQIQVAPRLRNAAPDETRFFLYALEDLFSSTWPDPKDARQAQPVCAWPNAEDALYAQSVRNFIARRQRIVHDIVRRVRVTHFASGYSQELVELLEKYMEFVSVRGEKHAVELDKCAELSPRSFLRFLPRRIERQPQRT